MWAGTDEPGDVSKVWFFGSNMRNVEARRIQQQIREPHHDPPADQWHGRPKRRQYLLAREIVDQHADENCRGNNQTDCATGKERQSDANTHGEESIERWPVDVPQQQPERAQQGS